MAHIRRQEYDDDALIRRAAARNYARVLDCPEYASPLAIHLAENHLAALRRAAARDTNREPAQRLAELASLDAIAAELSHWRRAQSDCPYEHETEAELIARAAAESRRPLSTIAAEFGLCPQERRILWPAILDAYAAERELISSEDATISPARRRAQELRTMTDNPIAKGD